MSILEVGSIMELLAPAGNLEIGIYALKAGADALYLGLKDFSARKFAGNFSFDDLRRIREFSSKNNRKIFCTLNTLIRDDEIDQILETLFNLEQVHIDGVIIQDIGLLTLIKAHFPKLKIHASTQMAIHNDYGLKMAQQEGITRVVLSRELPLKYIEYLRKSNPDLELEVFIHGALCYSFSGMCLWSGLELDRSANRGECAQICRNFFKTNKGENKYLFSCNDLCLGEDILKLRDIGINSLKIEGRMKDASYVVSTVKYYRSILDSQDNNGQIDITAKRQSQLAFARKQTKGYFESGSGKDLINTSYTGHQGIKIGRVKDVNYTHNEIKIDLLSLFEYPLQSNDTLLIFSNTQKWRFNAFNLKINQAKTLASIKLNGDLIQGPKKHEIMGLDVFITQGSFSKEDFPHLDYKNFPMFCSVIPVTIELNTSTLTIHTLSLNEMIQDKSFTYDIELSQALSNKDTKEVITEMFRQSKDSFFRVGEILLINNTPWKPNEIHLPLSSLKKIKNDFYSQIDSLAQGRRASCLKCIKQNAAQISPSAFNFFQGDRPLPYKLKTYFASLESINHYLDSFDNFFGDTPRDLIYIPLIPILFSENVYIQQLFKLLEKIRGQSLDTYSKIRIGINNFSHLSIVNSLTVQFPDLLFYLDIYAYAANIHAIKFWSEKCKLDFIFGHIDQSKNKRIRNIPLFISKGCMKKHCGIDCESHLSKEEIITNNHSRYRITRENCLTLITPIIDKIDKK